MRKNEIIHFINNEIKALDKKINQAFENYHSSGSNSTYKTLQRYELTREAFAFALDGVGENSKGYDVFNRQIRGIRAEVENSSHLSTEERLELLMELIKQMSYFKD